MRANRRRYPQRLGAIAVVAAASFAACKFSAPGVPQDGIDAQKPDANLMCTGASTECVSDTMLKTCTMAGGTAMLDECVWGCVMTGTPRCGKLMPAGGGVNGSDLDPASGLIDITLMGTTITINGDDGNIRVDSNDLRQTGTGVKDGIGYQIRNNVAIFRFKSLQVKNAVRLTGTHPIALVANGPISVDAVIDAKGSGQTPGPGGRIGAIKNVSAMGSGGGVGVSTNKEGAGGGGYGGSGGGGGGATAGGTPFGDDVITVLTGGGGGGGGGGGANAGVGGGGGGAVQLASNLSITIGAGGINAGGGGGRNGEGMNDGGGGGGAGGTILLEAPQITIMGKLAVNGGGGGATATGDQVVASDGLLDRGQAPGNLSGNGNGGLGGASNAIDGGRGQAGAMDASKFGAGGGGVGRIRLNTRTGTVTLPDVLSLSPTLTDTPTRCTQGRAALQ